MTQCVPEIMLDTLDSQRSVVLKFDATDTSSDGGFLLLGALDKKLGLSKAIASRIPDAREQSKVEHPIAELVQQRIMMIAMGYVDCNDATQLQGDPVLNVACERDVKDAGPLSSQPTLSRFENSVGGCTLRELRQLLEDRYVASLSPDTKVIVLDIDTTCDPTHGQQQLTFFNSHYDTYMYHPLMIFDADTQDLASVLLQPGNFGAAACAPYVLRRLIIAIKKRLPNVMICIRGDAAFATPGMFAILDRLDKDVKDIYYLFGFTKNSTVLRHSQDVMEVAKAWSEQSHKTVRLFDEFDYKTKSWDRLRHIIAKAEHSVLGPNPRFVVTNITGFPPGLMYQAYGHRGQMENYIKQFKCALGADRLSCHDFKANFFRLLMHGFAYQLWLALRIKVAEVAPELGNKQFDTLRLKLMKVAATVKTSVRRILIELPKAFPLAGVFRAVAENIDRMLAPEPSPAFV